MLRILRPKPADKGKPSSDETPGYPTNAHTRPGTDGYSVSTSMKLFGHTWRTFCVTCQPKERSRLQGMGIEDRICQCENARLFVSRWLCRSCVTRGIQDTKQRAQHICPGWTLQKGCKGSGRGSFRICTWCNGQRLINGDELASKQSLARLRTRP